jgi:hypothetical protein
VPNQRSKFVQQVRDRKPKHPEEAGYDLRLLNDDDDSAYRDAYDVLVKNKSIGVVIKFPKGGRRATSIMHSLFEAEAIHRMRHDPKLLALKRYAPTLLWHEPTTGVIVMPKYKPVKYGEYFEGFQQTFTCMVNDLVSEMRNEFDYGARNFGLNSRGHYVLLDAGLLGEVRKK